LEVLTVVDANRPIDTSLHEQQIYQLESWHATGGEQRRV
jgi:hypothetical protein